MTSFRRGALLLSLSLVVVSVHCITPARASAQEAGNAYLDAEVGPLIAAVRARMDSTQARIDAYQVLGRERVSVSARALRRDRVLYRQEIAARATWRRDGEREVHFLGARRAVPVAFAGVDVPSDSDLRGTAADFAPDPSISILLRLPGGGDEEEGGMVRHPLEPGAEAWYRYRMGEATTVRLGDGSVLRLREIHVLPRLSRSSLVSGSLWIDVDREVPVRGVFTLAAPARASLRIGGRGVRLPALSAAFELRYLTIEYGLWNNRWWMPRLVSMEGSGEAGVLGASVVFERTFEDYRIQAEGDPPAEFETPDPETHRALRICPPEEQEDQEERDCTPRTVFLPRDSLGLLESDLLPGSIFAEDTRLMTERELDELAELLGGLRWRGLTAVRPRVDWTPFSTSLLRYNRVEGLTVGTTATVYAEPLTLRAAGWIGLAERVPSLELGVARRRLHGRETLGVYRRLEAFVPADRPLELGNSMTALLFGRDDGDYYRATGVGMTVEQNHRSNQALRLDLFAERQRAVETHTDASVAGWLGEATFRENPAAEAADQVGIDALARFSRGLDPTGWRGELRLGMRAEQGTFGFVRPHADAAVVFPLPGRALLGAVEAGAGTALGVLPLQHRWSVGGASTVRGVRAGDRLTGDAFWRGRAEVGTRGPLTRRVLFVDAGWAGERDAIRSRPRLLSAGVGIGALDGLIRADLSRVLRGGSGWGLQLQIDAPL